MLKSLTVYTYFLAGYTVIVCTRSVIRAGMSIIIRRRMLNYLLKDIIEVTKVFLLGCLIFSLLFSICLFISSVSVSVCLSVSCSCSICLLIYLVPSLFIHHCNITLLSEHFIFRNTSLFFHKNSPRYYISWRFNNRDIAIPQH